MSRTAHELSKSVKLARQYALECQYDTALTFYVGLLEEVSVFAASIADGGQRTKWERVLEGLRRERAAVEEVMAEMRAFVNPAEAARRDRQAAGPAPALAPDPYAARDQRPVNYGHGHGGGMGGGGGMGIGGMGAGVGMGFCGGGLPDDLDYTRALQGLPGGGGRPSRGVDMGAGGPPRSGDVNDALYGDPDRFGPPKDGSGGPVRRPPPRPRPAQPRKAPTTGQSSAPSTGGGGSASAQAQARDRVKPPIPKFNKAGDGKAKGDGGRARFQPRPGEEELAALIESEMTFGETSTKWGDIAGQSEAKALLEEAVVFPVLMPDYYQGIRRPWKGVLLYGPPGTGKTMLAKAVASECGTTFFNISPATLTSKWRGDSEKMIRVLFEVARHYAPSTIFIDEIDSLCGQRGGGDEHEASRRAKGVLLTQMDGVGVDTAKIVMVLGATNHPWDIDEAMRRRLEKRIYIPLPTFDDRIELMRINTRALTLAPNVDFGAISRLLETQHYSGADLTNMCRDAAMMTMRRFMSTVDKEELRTRAAEIGKLVAQQPTTQDDFVQAMRNVPSSINIDNIRRFEDWQKEFETNV